MAVRANSLTANIAPLSPAIMDTHKMLELDVKVSTYKSLVVCDCMDRHTPLGSTYAPPVKTAHNIVNVERVSGQIFYSKVGIKQIDDTNTYLTA